MDHTFWSGLSGTKDVLSIIASLLSISNIYIQFRLRREGRTEPEPEPTLRRRFKIPFRVVPVFAALFSLAGAVLSFSTTHSGLYLWMFLISSVLTTVDFAGGEGAVTRPEVILLILTWTSFGTIAVLFLDIRMMNVMEHMLTQMDKLAELMRKIIDR
jgi:hypothetical protein